MTRTALTLADIAAVADITANAREPEAVFRAVEALARKAIGLRLFTIMRLHAASQEVERLYSCLPMPIRSVAASRSRGHPGASRCSTAARFLSPIRRMRSTGVPRSRANFQPRHRRDPERADPLSRTLVGHDEHLSRGRLVHRCRPCSRAVARRAPGAAAARRA